MSNILIHVYVAFQIASNIELFNYQFREGLISFVHVHK